MCRIKLSIPNCSSTYGYVRPYTSDGRHMENSKSITSNDEPVQAFRLGQPFDIEQVIEVGPGGVYSTGKAADGYIKDLEPIPPLKELRILWDKSISKLLPPRR